MTSRLLHATFAVLREALVELVGDPRQSLYAPVPEVKVDRGFLLHSDLYLADRILLVFDDVPTDGSGQPLFLTVDSLRSLVRRTRAVSPRSRTRFDRLISKDLSKDSFNQLYGFLHSSSHPWHAAIRRGLAAESVMVPLRRGEGYLIDDRKWLHGRLPATGAVRRRRFRRLIFGRQSEGLGVEQRGPR